MITANLECQIRPQYKNMLKYPFRTLTISSVTPA